ncbi:hypothetical protein Afil01_61280 [Actinorhabdospora filicis]|uniref:Chloramphenicol 3-O phosphotransferase n=1 Tax=Actinorhabdospora filicis TaxID=1785913 RepID=A0A9W6WD73_9ACTN|nr:chloramphenicol phosphotransferase CPT [Actinorhabdospora filicis]GLZ81321.1 hypothetical protein Afil01_61280 [Actinorhabdospora filicis]
MTKRVIILNGGSSSGKTGLSRCLQAVLPEPWLATGIDAFIDSLPASMEGSGDGIDVDAEGGVSVGPDFRRLEAGWMAGVAATARAGTPVIIDDVFLSGVESQRRWREVLEEAELDALWVGVRCAPEIAAGREIARGDRQRGMAVQQAEMVHRGVEYDIEVDTGENESIECARMIAEHLGQN